jgi:hypothetical protein
MASMRDNARYRIRTHIGTGWRGCRDRGIDAMAGTKKKEGRRERVRSNEPVFHERIQPTAIAACLGVGFKARPAIRALDHAVKGLQL